MLLLNLEVSMAQRKRNTVNTKSQTRRAHKKKKRRYRRLKRLICFFCFILILCGFLFVKRYSIALWRKGYSAQDRKILLNVDTNELKDYLELDQALDLSSWNEYANDHHFYDYALYLEKFPNAAYEDVIHYVDTFYDYYPTLVELGYDKEFCRDKMKLYSSDDFMVLAKNGYAYADVSSYLKIKGCQISDLKQYIDSGMEPLQAVLSITYPFIDSNYDAVSSYTIMNPKKVDTLVKAGFTLNDYQPNDLVQVNLPLQEIDSAFLRKEAAEALETMANDARAQGLYIGIRSAYRSYADQQEVYDYYINLYGYSYAMQLVSIPGSSEHQLGLGVDLTSQSVIDGIYGTFDQSAEYPWVMENCYKYGFILRYPENKTDITGAMNEPWHFRYVGKKAATEIYNNNLTLEEYTMQHGFSSDLIRN